MKALLILTVLTSLSAFAGNCDNATNQMEINECVVAEYQKELESFDEKLSKKCLKELGVGSEENPRDVLGSIYVLELIECKSKKLKAFKI